MARNLDKSQGMDPANAAVLSGGAPRNKDSVRESARSARSARRNKDKFFVPPDAIPKGWCAEWKRKSCLGRPEEADYGMEMAEGGWKNADPKQFPMLVPEGFEGKTIERGGMILMIRPAHMKKEALKLDREEALGQVRDKLTEIGMTGEGEAPRKAFVMDRGYDRPAQRMVPDDNGEDGYEDHEGSDARPGEQ